MELEKLVIALGFFDGVHIGHGALLRRTVLRARELNAVPAAITFDAYPKKLARSQNVPLLTTVEERTDLMRRLYGIEKVIVLPFNSDFMRMGWREFITDFLIARHGAVHLVAGHDFHFGCRGEGNPVRLQEQCTRSGIGCDIISSVTMNSITISSTYIRTLITCGEIDLAQRFLGHPHTIIARAHHCKDPEAHSNFSAMSFTLSPDRAVPAPGMYAARVWINGQVYPAATVIKAQSPAVVGQPVPVKSFLPRFSEDFHGKTVRLELFRPVKFERSSKELEVLCAQVM